jgi:hypothetical protein
MFAAALYAVLTAVLLSFTWRGATPKYHGYDWFWVAILTFPWSAILNGVYDVSVAAAVIIGIGLNALVIYLFGVLLTCVTPLRNHKKLPRHRANRRGQV